MTFNLGQVFALCLCSFYVGGLCMGLILRSRFIQGRL